jgi:hypothetical protein
MNRERSTGQWFLIAWATGPVWFGLLCLTIQWLGAR